MNLHCIQTFFIKGQRQEVVKQMSTYSSADLIKENKDNFFLHLTLCLVCLIVAVISWTCAKPNQLAVTMVYEAKAQINAAKQEGAKELAPEQIVEAESYLTKAETALKDDSPEAYRLAKRAYLMAQYAEVLAKRNKAERIADVEEAELEKLLREVESACRGRESAEQELKNLSR